MLFDRAGMRPRSAGRRSAGLHRRPRTPPGRAWSLAVLVVVNLLFVAALANWLLGSRSHPSTKSAPQAALPQGWTALDPQGRCTAALRLVRYADAWPLECQWRPQGGTLDGEAFPPPAGDPPFDHPRIVIYVDRAQTPAQIARVIAHEMGHMYLTRTAGDGPAWLRARHLPADTPASEWVEDYAEVFAAVYGPDLHDWQGLGTRPSPGELQSLAAQFFQRPPADSR